MWGGTLGSDALPGPSPFSPLHFPLSLQSQPRLGPFACRQPVSKNLPGCSSDPDSAKWSEIPASPVLVSHKPLSLRSLASCLPLEVPEGSSLPTPPGFLHQLQLRGRGRSCAGGLLRLSLQPPGAALHAPGLPGCGHGLCHSHTLLHAHPKVKAGASQTW